MSRIKNDKKKLILVCAMMMFLGGIAQVFGQSSNSSLRGTVMDVTEGVLPGATVTAKNVDTGVTATVLTNETGVYSFASLPPGEYEVSAGLDGFQTATTTDVKLGGGDASVAG